MDDFQNLKEKYEWLLRLDDDKLSNEVIYHELHFGADGELFDPRMEISDEWLDMN